ncbi:MAG: DUF4920 domain-containing protein [Vicinamibacterales bacterium]
MKSAIAMTVVLMAASLAASETKLGTGVRMKEATPIQSLVENPNDYVGKTVRVDGVATAVCSMMGCWMAVASDEDPKAPVVRLKVEDGTIVFPVSAKGQKVSAEGTFEKIGDHDEHAKEAASEHGHQQPDASVRYHIKATGALIR